MSAPICRIIRDPETKAVKGFDFDPTKLAISEPRKLSKGKFCNVRYNGGVMYIESPYLHAPTSVSSFEDADKKTMFLSMRGHEERSDIRAFLEAMKQLQERIVDQASAHSLMGDKYTRDMVMGVMSPLVKISDAGYPPAFRVTLPSRDGKDAFDAFKATDKGPEPCSLDDMDIRGARVRAIFTISSVWVVNKTWGVTAKATQVLVKPAFDAPVAGVCSFSDEALGASDDEGGSADRARSDDE